MGRELEDKEKQLADLEAERLNQVAEHTALLARLEVIHQEVEQVRTRTHSLVSGPSFSATSRPSFRRPTQSRLSIMNLIAPLRHRNTQSELHKDGSGAAKIPPFLGQQGDTQHASHTSLVSMQDHPENNSARRDKEANPADVQLTVSSVAAVTILDEQASPAQASAHSPAHTLAHTLAPLEDALVSATASSSSPAIDTAVLVPPLVSDEPTSSKPAETGLAPPPKLAGKKLSTRDIKQMRKELKKSLKQRKKDAKEKLKTLAKDLEHIQEENAELELKCDDQNDIIARQQDVVADLETKIMSLEEEVNELQDDRQEQQKQLAELETRYARLLREDLHKDPQGGADTTQARVRTVVQKESVLQQSHAQQDSNMLTGIFTVFSFGLFSDEEEQNKAKSQAAQPSGGGLFSLFGK
eukprot:c11544_g1_i1.p2 GENE.c11544_g1_i1~~c11544_g1_i1.p2  ORF type:complete len:412 (+),score=115.17 c11544_g1_i1:1408-2643(+)